MNDNTKKLIEKINKEIRIALEIRGCHDIILCSGLRTCAFCKSDEMDLLLQMNVEEKWINE